MIANIELQLIWTFYYACLLSTVQLDSMWHKHKQLKAKLPDALFLHYCVVALLVSLIKDYIVRGIATESKSIL